MPKICSKNVGTKLIWKKFQKFHSKPVATSNELMARGEHGKMHNQITLQQKWKISHQVSFDILIFKILFASIINMGMFLNFLTTLCKNRIFRKGLSKFIEIQTNVVMRKIHCN